MPDRYECVCVCVYPVNWVLGWPHLLLVISCRSDSSSPNHQADPGSLGSSEVRPLSWGDDATGGGAPYFDARLFLCCTLQQLSPTASIQDTQKWLQKNRFNSYTRLFSNFSGTLVDNDIRSGGNGTLETTLNFLTCQVLIC